MEERLFDVPASRADLGRALRRAKKRLVLASAAKKVLDVEACISTLKLQPARSDREAWMCLEFEISFFFARPGIGECPENPDGSREDQARAPKIDRQLVPSIEGNNNNNNDGDDDDDDEDDDDDDDDDDDATTKRR